jgi:hypothetical protein
VKCGKVNTQTLAGYLKQEHRGRRVLQRTPRWHFKESIKSKDINADVTQFGTEHYVHFTKESYDISQSQYAEVKLKEQNLNDRNNIHDSNPIPEDVMKLDGLIFNFDTYGP